MARLSRLVVPGEAHYLILRAQGETGSPGICADASDRAACLSALKEAAAAEQVAVHAYALLPQELQLLATPQQATGLGRLVQALGRRYVSPYNRRHQRRGSLWDGRFRCAVVEAGPLRLAVLRLVDGSSSEPGSTSVGQRIGGPQDGLVRDLPEVWQLGNTPFEREARYRELLALGLDAGEAARLRQAALGGWVLGTPAFTAALATSHARPTAPRPRGRPHSKPESETKSA
jgi:putative transposase